MCHQDLQTLTGTFLDIMISLWDTSRLSGSTTIFRHLNSMIVQPLWFSSWNVWCIGLTISHWLQCSLFSLAWMVDFCRCIQNHRKVNEKNSWYHTFTSRCKMLQVCHPLSGWQYKKKQCEDKCFLEALLLSSSVWIVFSVLNCESTLSQTRLDKQKNRPAGLPAFHFRCCDLRKPIDRIGSKRMQQKNSFWGSWSAWI